MTCVSFNTRVSVCLMLSNRLFYETGVWAKRIRVKFTLFFLRTHTLLLLQNFSFDFQLYSYFRKWILFHLLFLSIQKKNCVNLHVNYISMNGNGWCIEMINQNIMKMKNGTQSQNTFTACAQPHIHRQMKLCTLKSIFIFIFTTKINLLYVHFLFHLFYYSPPANF